VNISVHRDYGLPAWASGSETLVVASSHSGNTEETLSAYQQAREAGCSRLALSTGGRLAQLAEADGAPVWRFEHRGQPRAAVGFSFGLLLAALERLGLASPQEALVREAAVEMRRQQEVIGADSPTAKNPAKRMAGQLVGRYVTIFGAGILAPVARRWKGQLNEVAKAWGQFEYLPEADHNTLAGVLNPEDLLPRMMALFLTAVSDHPRNRLRTNLTRQAFMLEGINTDIISVQGGQPLAEQWTGLHFGDYMAYYLAMAYGVDPTSIPAIENLKRDLG
jgi:glucose/mannose-6-phosphate isomerase